MIRHGVNRQQLLPVPCDDACDVLVKFLFALGANQVLPALHGENDLE